MLAVRSDAKRPGGTMAEFDDRQAIINGLQTWCRGADLNRPELQVTVLAPDVRLAFYGPDSWVEGHDEIVEWLRGALANFEATHHYLTNVMIDFGDDDHATSIAYVLAWHRFVADQPDYTLHAEYHDAWERRAGQWLIVERQLKVAGSSDRASSRPVQGIGRRNIEPS